MSKSKILLILLVPVFFFSIWLFWPSQSLVQTEEEAAVPEERHLNFTPQQIEKWGIKVKQAGPGTLTRMLTTRGKIMLHPDYLVHVLPKVSGVVQQANKNIGDPVKSGEIIAVLESREIADIKAHYLAALEKERLAASHLEREARLYEMKVSAEQEFLNSKSAYQEATINVQLAKQQLKAFGLDENALSGDLRNYEIRSPMDGIIIERDITKGEFIPDTTTIYEIANLSTVWVEIGIYPQDIPQVRVGQKAEIAAAYDTHPEQAELIYISPIIKEETITAKAIALLPNPNQKWRPGTFVNVEIITDRIPVPLAVPKEAIHNIEGKQAVFVRTAAGFEKRVIETGRSDDKNAEVIAGLNPGQPFAVSETFLLKAELGKSNEE